MVLGLFKPNPAALAIDFGFSRVKVLQLSAEEAPSVVAAAALEVPETVRANAAERSQFLLEELPRLVSRGGFKAKAAMCSIPAWQTYVQHMQLTKVDKDTLEPALKQQLQANFGCDPSQIVVRHVEVGQFGRRNQLGTEVICFAIGRDIVMSYVELLRKMRLEVGGLHAEPVAVVNAFRHLHRREQDDQITTMYIDIGGGGTKVLISHGNELRFARSIGLGGRHLDQRLATTLHCDIETARRHRLEVLQNAQRGATEETAGASGLPTAQQAGAVLASTVRLASSGHGNANGNGAAVASAADAGAQLVAEGIEPLLDQLVEEVLMCVRYHLGLFPDRHIDRVLFMGGDSADRDLCRRLAQTIGAPAFTASPFTRFRRTGSERLNGVDRLDDATGWEVPVGLCACRAGEAA